MLGEGAPVDPGERRLLGPPGDMDDTTERL
jgi:hypothetical protein